MDTGFSSGPPPVIRPGASDGRCSPVRCGLPAWGSKSVSRKGRAESVLWQPWGATVFLITHVFLEGMQWNWGKGEGRTFHFQFYFKVIAFPSDHSECLCGEFLGSSSSLIINWPYPHARLPHPATTLEPAPLICVPSLQKCPNPPACCRQEPGSHSALCPFFTSHTRSISEPVRSTFQILLESIPSSHPTSLSKAQLSG